MESESRTGFWHHWALGKSFDAQAWGGLQADARKLFDALLACAQEDAPSRGRELGFLGFAMFWWPRGGQAPAPWGELIFGSDRRGLDAIILDPARHAGLRPISPTAFSNAAGAFNAKIPASPQATLHNRFLMSLLCAARERASGAVMVVSTDAGPQDWEDAADWASSVLERALPLPLGIHGRQARDAWVQKSLIDQGLASQGAAPSQKTAPRL